MKSNLFAKINRCNNSLRRDSFVNYQRFLKLLLSSNPSSVSMDLLSSLEEGDFTALLMKADSHSSTVYATATYHRLANQFCNLVRKYPFPSGTVTNDPKGRALASFIKSEHLCKRVNQRFRAYSNVRSPHSEVLNYASQWIQYVIGPEMDLAQLGSDCRFGPGASVGVHGSSTSLGAKLLSSKWTVTPGAFYLARAIMKDDIHVMELLQASRGPFFCVDPDAFNCAFQEKAQLVDSNKITFVPKTAMTERTIAIEPLLNGYLQLGVDSYLKRKLKRVGIDLADQSINQRLAREGSLPDQIDPWVTIDLSSASDSISIELCRYLLPPEWFSLLNSLRSHSYSLDGVVRSFHKFATMGNGFCFPLESLLFSSICHASCKKLGVKPEFQVYGDDIIVRQSVSEEVLRNLKICGFRPNSGKTFISGPFRESCGTDWFNGLDVRPITLDYAFDSIQNIFKFCNLLKSKGVWEDIFYECREFLISLIPKEIRFVRPFTGTVDSALEVPLDEFMVSPFSKWDRNIQAWSWKEIMNVPVVDVRLQDLAGYPLAVMKGALLGMKSNLHSPIAPVTVTGPNPYTLRRETRTKIRRQAYSGTVSNWVPGQKEF